MGARPERGGTDVRARARPKAHREGPSDWTEAEFPDLHQAAFVRRNRAQAQPQGDASVDLMEFRADLMEFRAIHAAALLVGQYERTAQAAGVLANTPEMRAPQGDSVPDALMTFLRQDFKKLVKYKERSRGRGGPPRPDR